MGCSKSKNIEVIEQAEKNEKNELIKSMENKTIKNNNLISIDKSSSGNGLLFSYNKGTIYNKTILKRIRLRKRQNIPKKEPFTITTINYNSLEIYLIKINASSFLVEYLIPIWFEKNTYIKFITLGKWRIDKNYEFTDSAGMPSSSSLKYNYGAAVARVGSGKTFLLCPNEFTYYTMNEGPLYLKINLPKKIKVNPEGTMEIKVFDGKLMSKEEIHEKIGWKEKNMKYDFKYSNELENELTVEINNLRMNPILYYEKNIENNQNKIWTEDFVKKMKKYNETNETQPLIINNHCYSLLHNYIELNYERLKSKCLNRSTNINLGDLENKISFHISCELMCDNKVGCKITKKNDGVGICNQYLFDNNFRKNIFMKEYTSIAIKIIEDFYENSNLIILAFMKGGIN
jgi:hypothetical protein